MAQKWLRGLPLIALGLLFLAGCQIDQDAPSDPLGRVVEGAAKCKSPALNSASTIFPPSPDPRRGQVEDLCKAILDGAIDPDIGADQLHVLAYSGWQAGTLASETTDADVAAYNTAVRGLNQVAALGADEKPVWTTTNISDGEFLAVGQITNSSVADTFCFASGEWCFVVNAGVPYYFLAEAIVDQPALGLCPGPFPNDCAPGAVHIDFNPDSAIDDESESTNVTVWKCETDFGTRHARFPVSPTGTVDSLGVYGTPVTGPIPSGLCSQSAFLMNDVQQWVWTGLQPLRWALGVGVANAGSTGTTFGRASEIATGQFGVPRTRDILCKVSAKFAAISDGAECKLFEGNSPSNPLVASCTTQKTEVDGPKSARCPLLNIPVPGDNTPYYLVVDKQGQTNTAHHAEDGVDRGLSPDDPARDEYRLCDVNLSTGNVDCRNNVGGSLD